MMGKARDFISAMVLASILVNEIKPDDSVKRKGSAKTKDRKRRRKRNVRKK